MKNIVFGEMTFNTGWKSTADIMLFGKNMPITVKAKAYYEKDGITAEQEKAFVDWYSQKCEKLKITEKLLANYSNGNENERFCAKTLLFNRDGSYALLLNDSEDDDGGVAVCLAPDEKILSQDEYL